eukprot:7383192-Prymnesium_polylepis.2
MQPSMIRYKCDDPRGAAYMAPAEMWPQLCRDRRRAASSHLWEVPCDKHHVSSAVMELTE